MSEAGFEFFGSTSAEVSRDPRATSLATLTVEEASENGYGIYVTTSVETIGEEERQRGLDYYNSLSEAERLDFIEALEGRGDAGAVAIEAGEMTVSIPMEGCVG